MSRSFRFLPVLALLCSNVFALAQAPDYARDPHQAIDESYTAAIRKYTTAPEFNSPLTDYLPASKSVPTPAKVLGDVSGAPDMLPYAEDVYKYFRELAAASPRVRVVTIGHSEEGREMIAVAVADESLLAHQKENDERLAKLADPRTIDMDDTKAAPLIAASTPVYYITGTIHSPETGAPTALMELAYRLAVDDSPYIQYIRSHVITLITPVVEVDGRDRMVDIYRWHKAHPGETYPRLYYWGHYVAHDNNRDAMTMNLALTRNVLNTYIGWHAQVLHDLHESVPFLYDNTVGDEPYNSWIDPILTNEWQMLGWSNVQAMAQLNMPGVFTHGDFDTWSPGYLMFLAAMHNGISRLYETFGNGGADTVERVLTPDEYERTWYKPNPPLPKVLWSQRDNNNYEESALLTTLSYFAQNSKLFLNNYYLKSKRSILKPAQNGPAAYVLTADDPSPSRQAMLLRVLHDQHVEVQQTTAPVTVELPQLPKSSDADKTMTRNPANPSLLHRVRFPLGATSSAWTSPTRASPTRCSIVSSGRLKIRRRVLTMTPAGRSAPSSASTLHASSTPPSSKRPCISLQIRPPHPAPHHSPATPSSLRTTPTRRSSRCAINSITPPSRRQMPRWSPAATPIPPAHGSSAASPALISIRQPRHCICTSPPHRSYPAWPHIPCPRRASP